MKIGRNAPCYCGSGKKYKKCHLGSDEASSSESVAISFEAKGLLPAVGLPGTVADLSISPLARPSAGPFTVVATLMRPGQPPLAAEELRNHEHLPGDSQLLFGLPGSVFERVRTVQIPDHVVGELIVVATCNKDGRLSKLTLASVKAASAREARDIARGAFNRILNDISMIYDVPMDVYQTDVIDDVTGNSVITLQVPFSSGVWSTQLRDGEEFRKYAGLYREGLSARSSLYSFLCFYKILEAIEEQYAEEGADRATAGAEPLKRRPIRLPKTDQEIRAWVAPIFPVWYVWNSYEIASIAPPDARGAKLAVTREKYLKPIRLAVAHAFLDSTGLVDIEEPTLQNSVGKWLPYTRMMARRSIFERCNVLHF